jgi:hypothetical protein
MNISSSAAVSTLVPQATAAGSGQSSGQNWAATKEVQNWATSESAPAPGGTPEVWAATNEVQNWANSDGAQAPQVKAESWAVSKESENWAGDNRRLSLRPNASISRSEISGRMVAPG